MQRACEIYTIFFLYTTLIILIYRVNLQFDYLLIVIDRVYIIIATIYKISIIDRKYLFILPISPRYLIISFQIWNNRMHALVYITALVVWNDSMFNTTKTNRPKGVQVLIIVIISVLYTLILYEYLRNIFMSSFKTCIWS